MKKTRTKKQHIIFIITLISLVSIILVPMVTSTNENTNTIIYVDDDGTADFTTIQEAIDHANPGDTIWVMNGEYSENILIDKSINLIGESNQFTIIHGVDVDKYKWSIITIRSGGSNTTIKNFKIDNNENYWKTALKIYANNITIQNNNIVSSNNITWEMNGHKGKYHGHRAIEPHSCSFLNISHNYIDDYTYAFQIYSCKNMNIEQNHIDNCQYFICRSKIHKSTIKNNFINKTTQSVIEGSDNLIQQNIFIGCQIKLKGTNNIFEKNTIRNNTWTSFLRLEQTSKNIIKENNFFIEWDQYPIIESKPKKHRNVWIRNYWNQTIPHPKLIRKIIILPIRDERGIFHRVAWFECDWFPAIRPHKYTNVCT